MSKDYKCTVCGKSGVKLWRPYMRTEPLVCAECAEKRQSQMEYDEVIWKEEGKSYVGKPTGRKMPLEKWKVNEKGKIPNYNGPGPEGIEMEMTDQLIVDLKDYGFSSGETTIVSAIPSEEGFWGYTSVPQDKVEWWEKLPTR